MRKLDRPSARNLAWVQAEYGFNNRELADWYDVSVATVRRWKAEDKQAAAGRMEAKSTMPRTEVVSTKRKK